MLGNAAEWTDSIYCEYPYHLNCNDLNQEKRRVVRGGSWSDRPLGSTASVRRPYQQWQKMFNVGFRVVCDSLDVSTNN